MSVIFVECRGRSRIAEELSPQWEVKRSGGGRYEYKLILNCDEQGNREHAEVK